MVWRTSSRRDLGDFQTPVDLVAAVLKTLGPIGTRWPRVLEPTCGRGNFIDGLLNLAVPPREIRGFEIQPTYCELARQIDARTSSTHVEITQANLFDVDLRRDVRWNATGPLLVIGNPPWITNAELGSLGSNNVPRKVNMKGARGIDAMTGESNFDITEYIWIKLIQELAFEHPTIALLCKTGVARNILRFAASVALPLTHASIRKIDAHTWFNAAVDACLFCVTLGLGVPRYQAEVYVDLVSNTPETIIGVENGELVADIKAYKGLSLADGSCALTWRQGLKHDAASVMEIVQISDRFQNKHGEIVEIESEHMYPLLKSTALFHQTNAGPHRFVIVTQRRVGEDTRPLESLAPRLWRYLTSHMETFKERKSSIYRGSPPFAMFGIGDYSFAPYKVAISGLHKTPRFRAVGPVNGQPVMFDDTCYFVACSTPEQAALLVSLLNDPISLNFIHSLVFWDSKRPITKKVLQRINLKALLSQVDRIALLARADVEIERLKGTPNQQPSSWPADLEEFFSESAPGKVVPMQMTLFETP